MKRVLLGAVLVAALGGCARTKPTQAGGKPVDYWVEALRNPDPQVRKEAVFKLGNVGPADPAAYPAVVGAIRDADPKVRCEVILALMKFGPRAKEAGPTLGDLKAHDPDARVRSHASRALEKIGTEPDSPK
ncbi:MAG: hypothetical protein JWO38_3065 [Gemmataceae bacterium]|nr:hypothetical protein [Gemmataceae bacterium]